MCKKTVLKRLLKLADITPEIAERIAHDSEGGLVDRPVIPNRANATVVEESGTESLPALEDVKGEDPAEEPDPSAEDPAPFAALREQTNQPADRPQRASRLASAPRQEPPPRKEPEAPPASVGKGASKSAEKPSAADLLRERLVKDGFTEEAFVSLARNNDFIGPDEGIDALNEQQHQYLDEQWGEVVKALKKEAK